MLAPGRRGPFPRRDDRPHQRDGTGRRREPQIVTALKGAIAAGVGTHGIWVEADKLPPDDPQRADLCSDSANGRDPLVIGAILPGLKATPAPAVASVARAAWRKGLR